MYSRITPTVEVLGKRDGGAVITARMDCADFDAAMEFMEHVAQFLKDRWLANNSAEADAVSAGAEQQTEAK